jgi:vanadium chloroperoxidase
MINEKPGMANDPVLYWNKVGLDLNRISATLPAGEGGGQQGGPTMGSRALGILHLAIHDAYFSIDGTSGYATYLAANGSSVPADEQLPPRPAGATDAVAALSGAAFAALKELYVQSSGDAYSAFLANALANSPGGLVNPVDVNFEYGQAVAKRMVDYLAVQDGEIGAMSGDPMTGLRYTYQQERGKFRPEPTHAVSMPLPTAADPHGPFYGEMTRLFAVQTNDHRLAKPPRVDDSDPYTSDDPAYVEAVSEVRCLGGAPTLNSTTRRPDQTTAAYFWAYDGARLIGTPPRLYNQIVRNIAWKMKKGVSATADTAEFVRLFALVNAAMGDAGVFAWKEKYRFNFWRPLSGVREHGDGTGIKSVQGATSVGDIGDPFWLALGAPETNSDRRSLKPPFPAYPSGHATFGAAALQIVRLFYKKRDQLSFPDDAADKIPFDFVSDELNGLSRDLYQPLDPGKPIDQQDGNVRTRIVRRFPSCWHAIFENGASRLFLGVHFVFDAFAAADVHANPSATPCQKRFKDPTQIKYLLR